MLFEERVHFVDFGFIQKLRRGDRVGISGIHHQSHLDIKLVSDQQMRGYPDTYLLSLKGKKDVNGPRKVMKGWSYRKG